MKPFNPVVNRTPEFEEKRLAGVRRALKGKPATEEQRNARYKGLMKAWKDGRCKPPVMSPEVRQKLADARRGIPRPPEVIEKMRQAAIGRKYSPEVRKKMSVRQKEYHKKFGTHPNVLRSFERWRNSKEGIEHRKRIFNDPEREKKRLKALRGKKWSSEIIEKRVRPMRGRPHTLPHMAKCPSHHAAISGKLRSPSNLCYEFRNLTHWVRTNGHLFHPDDIIWRNYDTTHPRTLQCRASKGLGRLFGRGNYTPGTWKGWTVISFYEQIKHPEDLLDRTTISEQQQSELGMESDHPKT